MAEDHDDDGAGQKGTPDSDAARFEKIEAEQREQRGILEQIRDRLGAGEKQAHAAAQDHTEQRLEHPPAETIAEQVRKAVEDVDAERAAREQKAAHDKDHERLKELAETPPREGATGWRGRLQAAMYGPADR